MTFLVFISLVLVLLHFLHGGECWLTRSRLHAIKLVRSLHATTTVDDHLETDQSINCKKVWQGNRKILKRKRQVPETHYSPQDVVQLIAMALQQNDDPQLDHGCCVLLEFKSPNGALSQSGLDPLGYGQMLRASTDNYELLLDNQQVSLVGEPLLLQEEDQLNNNSSTVIQKIKVDSWAVNGKSIDRFFNFHLRLVDGMWLVDDLLLCT